MTFQNQNQTKDSSPPQVFPSPYAQGNYGYENNNAPVYSSVPQSNPSGYNPNPAMNNNVGYDVSGNQNPNELRHTYLVDTMELHPIIPALLSLLLPGLGNLVMNQTEIGIVNLAVAVGTQVILVIPFFFTSLLGFLGPFVILALPFLFLYVLFNIVVNVGIRIYACIDIYILASRLQRNRQIGAGECTNSLAASFYRVMLKRLYIYSHESPVLESS